MRILIAIAHYYGPKISAGGTAAGLSPRFHHGSTTTNPAPRLAALGASVAALHQLFGSRQNIINQVTLVADPSNRDVATSIDVVICTARGCHLLAELRLPAESFRHHATDAHPPLLGYECHDVLRAGLGQDDYDYFGFMEDDLIVHDPWFFRKLRWFNAQVGDDALLQPNRYEVGPLGLVHKAYIDGDLPARATAEFQNVSDRPVLNGTVMGFGVEFRRASNPHSGCFFLNRLQMEHWAARPYFLDRSSAFVGPLESAATMGVARTFRVYKSAPRCASFLETQHYGTGFLGQLRRRNEAPRGS